MTYVSGFESSVAVPPAEQFGAITRNVAHYFADAMTETVQGIQALMPQVFGSSAMTYAIHRQASFVGTANLTFGIGRAARVDLVSFAYKRLQDIKSQGKANVTPEVQASLGAVLFAFVEDDGPTPQLAPTYDQSLELQWLSGGMLLTVSFESSGDYNMLAIGSGGEVVFDHDVAFGDVLSVTFVEGVTEFLDEMSKSVKNRPALWR